MLSKYLETGKILTTHGVRGEVKIEPWADSPEFLLQFRRLFLCSNGTVRELTVERIRTAGAVVLCKFREYDAPETASVLRGRIISFAREDVTLPEGSFFLTDAIGMTVRDCGTGEALGTVKDLSDTGVQMLFEAVTPTGAAFYVPNVPAFVDRADLEKGELWIHNIPGLIDGGEAVEEEK